MKFDLLVLIALLFSSLEVSVSLAARSCDLEYTSYTLRVAFSSTSCKDSGGNSQA